MLQGEYIRADHCREIFPGRLSCCTIAVFAVLSLAGPDLKSAGAQAADQPAANPAATDGALVSTATNTRRNPAAPANKQPITKPTSTAGGFVSEPTMSGQPAQPVTKPTPTAGGAAGTPLPRAEEYRRKVGLCSEAKVEGTTWLDQTHDFVGEQLCEPAVWFDSFFVQDRTLEDVRPNAFILWRNAVRWSPETPGLTLLREFSFRYRLPNLDRLLKKARLVIESRSTADKFTTQPGQATDPGLDPVTGARTPTVAVRADFLTKLRSLVSTDVGLKVHFPLDPFARMRYQYTKPLGPLYLIRFNETALYRHIEHFTETSELDFERKITTFTLLQWGNYATYTEGIAGIAWNSGIGLFSQLTPKSAISYNVNMWGVNHPDWIIQNYRIGTLYRKNFYRSWLFFELSPEMNWPRGRTHHRSSNFAFTATLEAQFGR